jgi:site-specific DNA-methyltransferase (adenine-specific)
MVRDLVGTMKNNDAEFGVFVTLNDPTRAMEQAAREAGSVEVFNRLRPRVQILTVQELFEGKKPDLPPVHDIISAAAAARRAAARRPPKAPTPEEIRQSPSLKLPITGGRAKDSQKDLPLDEPLLTSPLQIGRKGKRQASR